MWRFGLLIAWAVMTLTFVILRPDTFGTFDNAQAILGSQAVLLVLTLGLIIPFSAGEFDISIAGNLSVSLVLVGWLNVIHGVPIGFAIVITLAVGTAIGLTNAFFVVGIGLDSIVVTLGTGTLLAGAALGINQVTTTGISDALVTAVRYNAFGLPLSFYYALALTTLVWYVFAYTPLGRYLFFVGAGRDVARLAGIRVDVIRVGTFAASGFTSALAGVILCGYLAASDALVGGSFLLPAFAGAFLGATAITPGRFNAWGTFIAVYFLVTGIDGLQSLGFSGWIEQVFNGASLVLAVTFSRLASRREAG